MRDSRKTAHNVSKGVEHSSLCQSTRTRPRCPHTGAAREVNCTTRTQARLPGAQPAQTHRSPSLVLFYCCHPAGLNVLEQGHRVPCVCVRGLWSPGELVCLQMATQRRAGLHTLLQGLCSVQRCIPQSGQDHAPGMVFPVTSGPSPLWIDPCLLRQGNHSTNLFPYEHSLSLAPALSFLFCQACKLLQTNKLVQEK